MTKERERKRIEVTDRGIKNIKEINPKKFNNWGKNISVYKIEDSIPERFEVFSTGDTDIVAVELLEFLTLGILGTKEAEGIEEIEGMSIEMEDGIVRFYSRFYESKTTTTAKKLVFSIAGNKNRENIIVVPDGQKSVCGKATLFRGTRAELSTLAFTLVFMLSTGQIYFPDEE